MIETRAVLPLTDRVTVSWIGEIPMVKVKTRAHLSETHILSVREGVVRIDSWMDINVIRGGTDHFDFRFQPGVVIINVKGRGVRDWRTSRAPDGSVRLGVYLDRKVTGNLLLETGAEILPDRIIDGHPVNLLSASGFERQSGVIAVLRSDDYKIEPSRLKGLVRVDSGRIPRNIRKKISGEILYTWKYLGAPVSMRLNVSEPKRRSARVFADAMTMVNVREEAMNLKTTLNLDIARSAVAGIDAVIGPDINLTGVTGSNLLEFTSSVTAGETIVHCIFKDRVKGHMSLVFQYEKMLSPGRREQQIPVFTAENTVGRTGHVAVAAMSNLEIGIGKMAGIYPMDISELPESSKNESGSPVLLAWRYGQAPWQLVIDVARHQEINVPIVMIDTANYMSLVTVEGTVVTQAWYRVRNKNRQFLKLTLPPGAAVWSVLVDSKPVQLSKDKSGRVLIPLKKSAGKGNSIRSYMVEVVFRDSISPLKGIRPLQLHLPTCDIKTAEMAWSVYLPGKYEYHSFSGNVDRVKTNAPGKLDLKDKNSIDIDSLTRQMSGGRSFKSMKKRVPMEAADEVLGLAQVEEKSANAPGKSAAPPAPSVRRQKGHDSNGMSDRLILQQAFMENKNLTAAAGDTSGLGAQSIRMVVPRRGHLERFTKLYPTEAEKAPYIKAGYYSDGLRSGAVPVIYLFTIIVFLIFGAVGMRMDFRDRGLHPRTAAFGAGIYVLLIMMTHAVMGYSMSRLMIAAAVAWTTGYVWQHVARIRKMNNSSADTSRS